MEFSLAAKKSEKSLGYSKYRQILLLISYSFSCKRVFVWVSKRKGDQGKVQGFGSLWQLAQKREKNIWKRKYLTSTGVLWNIRGRMLNFSFLAMLHFCLGHTHCTLVVLRFVFLTTLRWELIVCVTVYDSLCVTESSGKVVAFSEQSAHLDASNILIRSWKNTFGCSASTPNFVKGMSGECFWAEDKPFPFFSFVFMFP